MTIQENNIVQTVASAAGTLSSIIFVLPGLVIIGWWTGFPYWMSFAICALGGIARRHVLDPAAPRAGHAVGSALSGRRGLRRSAQGRRPEQPVRTPAARSRAGLLAVVVGLDRLGRLRGASSRRACSRAMSRAISGSARGGATGFDFLLSFALFARRPSGRPVGRRRDAGRRADRAGSGACRITRHWPAAPTPTAHLAQDTWSHQVRFVGAGTIARRRDLDARQADRPVVGGLRSAMAASRARDAGGQARAAAHRAGHPDRLVGLFIARAAWCRSPCCSATSPSSAGSGDHMRLLVIGGLLYVVVMSFFVSAVCGYMAGLIGSSNSPLSGIGILAVIGASLLLVLGVRPHVAAERRARRSSRSRCSSPRWCSRSRRSPTTTCRT